MSSVNESYSSDAEEEIEVNQKSDVLLGFVDVEIDQEEIEAGEGDEPTIEDTFIGGQPVWLHPNSRPNDELISCGNCGAKMALLLQAFSPFEDEFYDRVIYIFGCSDTKQCSKKKGSVKVIRGVCKDPKKITQLEEEEAVRLKESLDEKLKIEEKKKLQFEVTKDLFGKNENSNANPFSGDSNPFGTASNPFGATSNPFEKKESAPAPAPAPAAKSFAEVAAKNKPETKPTKTTSSSLIDLPSYSAYFLYVKDEKFKKISDPVLEKYKNMTEMDALDPEGASELSSSSAATHLDPGAAKISNMLDDSFFEAFMNKVKHNPSQVLRYELGGKPLLYTGRDSVAAKFLGKEITIPNPGYNPSSTRQFELQLMPKVIMDLERGIVKKDILEGMEWGTIIACTDSEDYMPELDENHVGYIEEWCGVQWEESV